MLLLGWILLCTIAWSMKRCRADSTPKGLLWSSSVRFGGTGNLAISSSEELLFMNTKIGLLLAMNVTDGSTVWTHKTEIVALYAHVSSPYVAAAPVGSAQGSACNEVVFIGGTYALSACTGHLLWHTPLPQSNYSSPVAAGAALLVNGDDVAVYGLRSSSGEVLFRTRLQGAKVTEPVLAGPALFLVATSANPAQPSEDGRSARDGRVYGLHTSTGEVVWVYTAAKRGTSFLSSPAVSHPDPGVAVVSATHPSETHLLVALNASTGAELWHYQSNSRVTASPVFDNEGAVVAASAGAHVFRVADSVRLWSSPLDAAVPASVGISPDGLLVVAITTVGTLFGLELKTGGILWRQHIGGASVMAPLVLSDDTALVSTTGGLVSKIPVPRQPVLTLATEEEDQGTPPPGSEEPPAGGDEGGGGDDGDDADGGQAFGADERSYELEVLLCVGCCALVSVPLCRRRWGPFSEVFASAMRRLGRGQDSLDLVPLLQLQQHHPPPALVPAARDDEENGLPSRKTKGCKP